MRKSHAVPVALILILFGTAYLSGCGSNRWTFDKTNLVTLTESGKVIQMKMHCEAPEGLMTRDSFLVIASHLTEELDLFLGVRKDQFTSEDVAQPTAPNEIEVTFDIKKEIVNYTTKSIVTPRNVEPGKKVGDYSLAQSGWTWPELHRRWGIEE